MNALFYSYFLIKRLLWIFVRFALVTQLQQIFNYVLLEALNTKLFSDFWLIDTFWARSCASEIIIIKNFVVVL